ncbi:SDR family NAD(P)-dependent oxidoreductase [Xanthomarina sp. F1114]|uniref:SDR family NAD(P)-dependent oxidoreductase n=1 Tax=Xanthomarina sp. F1114 TaxID=2996019 RepID=UPI00225E00AC|nr:SDR family oxidoreductase [Xanthomarina sp. F1114]MCX7546941.1 SDR family NAD(P)-dependent oxidoreductase [Xanthomarina sp. F1114]
MRKIIIIGGTKGIGKALVENLKNDFEIINISRTASELEYKNIKQFQMDVLEDELPEILEADALIYCPGSINLKPISRLSLDDFKEDFNINVLGAVKVIKKYLPVLKKGNTPSILLFSSVAVKLGMPFHASIATAKGGVEGLVKSLGAELAPSIRVNAIAPTLTDTNLANKLLRNDEMKKKMIERHPLKKYLEPQEVADMAQFLISDKAASISGQIIELDCGIVSFKI